MPSPRRSRRACPQLIVSDAELVPGALAAQPPGTLATSAALDPSQLPPAGSDFVAASRPSTAVAPAATPPTATRRWR